MTQDAESRLSVAVTLLERVLRFNEVCERPSDALVDDIAEFLRMMQEPTAITVFDRIAESLVPQMVSPDAFDLFKKDDDIIAAVTSPDPKVRATTSAILGHPTFSAPIEQGVLKMKPDSERVTRVTMDLVLGATFVDYQDGHREQVITTFTKEDEK